MTKPDRRPKNNSIARMVFVAISLVFQVGWILLRVQWLNGYSEIISAITGLLAITVVLKLNSKNTNSAMKMPWVMLIMAFPVMGLSMYLMFEMFGDPGVGKRLRKARQGIADRFPQDTERAFVHLQAQDLSAANQCRYLWKRAGYPVYENTSVKYYPEGALALEDMKEELRKAKSFIFMEYFIVEDESAFRELEEILVDKAKQGVEVRLMYDDIGSVGKVNMIFAKRLNEKGIRCVPFNPALPILNLFMNHRDHRKITVIDGKVGFTGGYNLADEYFDRTHPYGKWKDTGLKLEGEAVRSLTATFLELWDVQVRKTEEPGRYMDIRHSVPARGFVQPFADDPLDEERVAENVYLNLINQANRTLYFMTPYLIITDEMEHALGRAAMRGVDVRIITPGIPDKKTVYAVTRSYYPDLIRQGVRIYEYTPGFCHAKQCICDSKIATVGTSNLDYRSLYHHFENDVLLTGCSALEDIVTDFEDTFCQCREVTDAECRSRSTLLRAWQSILRLFAPLM